MNPSKRIATGVFLVRIGNGFIVNSQSVRLDKLEPPMLGCQNPEQFIIDEACAEIKANPSYKDWKVTIRVEVEPWKGIPSHKLREKREELWWRIASWKQRARRED